MSKTQISQKIIVSSLIILLITQKTLQLSCTMLTGCVEYSNESNECSSNLLYDNIYDWESQSKKCCCNDTGLAIQQTLNGNIHCSTLTGCIAPDKYLKIICVSNKIYNNPYHWISQNKNCCCDDSGLSLQNGLNGEFDCSALAGCVSKEDEEECEDNQVYKDLYFWKKQNKNCCCTNTAFKLQTFINKEILLV